MAPISASSSASALAISALGLGEHNEDSKDILSDLLTNKGFLLVSGLLIASVCVAGWLAYRTCGSTESKNTSLPCHRQPGSRPSQTYGSVTESTSRSQPLPRPPSQLDAPQSNPLYAQIHSLKATITTLEARLRRADSDVEERDTLRADARQSKATISSLRSQLERYRTQTVDNERSITSLRARASSLLEAKNSSDADCSVMRTEIQRFKSVTESSRREIETLQEQVQSGDQTISLLKTRIASCKHCIPPTQITSLQKRGLWFREQARLLDKEGGLMIFEALNPKLVGPKAEPMYNGTRIDLHRQFEETARKYTAEYVTLARKEGLKKIIFVVGQGNHAVDGISKLQPTTLNELMTLGLEGSVPSENPGEIVVNL